MMMRAATSEQNIIHSTGLKTKHIYDKLRSNDKSETNNWNLLKLNEENGLCLQI